MKKLIFFLLLAVFYVACYAQDKSTEITGVWKCTEDSFHSTDTSWTNKAPQPGLYFFGKKYYGYMYVGGNKSRPLMAEEASRKSISEIQMRSIFMDFFANSGTYNLEGTKLTIYPEVSLWPNLMEGGSIQFENKVQKNKLYLSRRMFGGIRKYKLIRIE